MKLRNKAYKLYLDMPSRVFVKEEVELKEILGYIFNFISKQQWNIVATEFLPINNSLLFKLLIIHIIILQFYCK